MEHFDQIVCDPRLRRRELEGHLAGPDPARSFLGEYRVLTTSGTTGLRGIFALTHDEAEVWVAATLRTGVRAGIRPDARAVGIGTPSRVHLTRQLFAAVRGAPAGPDVSTATPLSELVAVAQRLPAAGAARLPLRRRRPGRRAARRPPDIHLTAGGFGGEPLTPGLRRRIRAAWGFEPARVVDADDNAVPPGTPGSKVLLTTSSTTPSRSSATSSATRRRCPRAPTRPGVPTAASPRSTGAAPTSSGSPPAAVAGPPSTPPPWAPRSATSHSCASTSSSWTSAGCTPASSWHPTPRPAPPRTCALRWSGRSRRPGPSRRPSTSRRRPRCSASPAASSGWSRSDDPRHAPAGDGPGPLRWSQRLDLDPAGRVDRGGQEDGRRTRGRDGRGGVHAGVRQRLTAAGGRGRRPAC